MGRAKRLITCGAVLLLAFACPTFLLLSAFGSIPDPVTEEADIPGTYYGRVTLGEDLLVLNEDGSYRETLTITRRSQDIEINNGGTPVSVVGRIPDDVPRVLEHSGSWTPSRLAEGIYVNVKDAYIDPWYFPCPGDRIGDPSYLIIQVCRTNWKLKAMGGRLPSLIFSRERGLRLEKQDRR